MKLFKEDFLIELERKDDIKEAFLMCSENKLVLPFLPVFQADCENLFMFSFFTEEIFEFPTSHYIRGFEIIYKGQKIKYGGKTHITNIGTIIKSVFLSIGIRKSGHGIAESVEQIQVDKVLVKLLSKAYIIYGQDINELEKLEIYPKYIFKTGNDLFFVIPSRYKTVHEKYLIKNLPKDSSFILEKIPYKRIKSVGEKTYISTEDFLNKSKQTKNFILVRQKNYLIPLYTDA